jgi:hypothetical protein
MFYDGNVQCFSYVCSDLSQEVIDQVKYTNKLCLPPEVLYEINETDTIPSDTRLYFKLSKRDTLNGQVCAVHEFSAPPGVAYIPYHIMESLKFEEGETIRLFQVKARKGAFMKLQFHTCEFASLLEPKEILEQILSQDYPVVTRGHTLSMYYKNTDKVYKVNIVETKPSAVIEIINTDINVDFAEPLDPTPIKKAEEGRRRTNALYGAMPINNVAPKMPPVDLDYCSSDDEEKEDKDKINNKTAFSGQGNKLGVK